MLLKAYYKRNSGQTPFKWISAIPVRPRSSALLSPLQRPFLPLITYNLFPPTMPWLLGIAQASSENSKVQIVHYNSSWSPTLLYLSISFELVNIYSAWISTVHQCILTTPVYAPTIRITYWRLIDQSNRHIPGRHFLIFWFQSNLQYQYVHNMPGRSKNTE